VLVQVAASEGLTKSLATFKTYICAEILADTLDFSNVISNGTEVEINDETIKVDVTKKG
jgi:isoleucyl-tRNA synthetase